MMINSKLKLATKSRGSTAGLFSIFEIPLWLLIAMFFASILNVFTKIHIEEGL